MVLHVYCFGYSSLLADGPLHLHAHGVPTAALWLIICCGGVSGLHQPPASSRKRSLFRLSDTRHDSCCFAGLPTVKDTERITEPSPLSYKYAAKMKKKHYEGEAQQSQGQE